MEQAVTEICLDQARVPLVLALDVGTSSTRAALLDAAGRHVTGAFHQQATHLETTPDGGAVLDPDALLEAVAATIDGALAAAGSRAVDIRGVGISCFWHSLMGIDDAGRPLTPVYTWADNRAAPAVARLAARLDPAAYHARTGTILHTSYPLAKLAWLGETCPELVASAARWLSFAEYLQLRLLGRATCSVSMASGTGYFDQTRQVWDAPALAAAGVTADRLSPIDDAPLSGLTAAYAARWPALAAVPWFPALGDGACSNVGSGAVGLDRLAVMVGTTGAMRLLWEGPAIPPPPGLWLYRLDRRHVLLGGALSAGGNLFDWLRDRLRLPEDPAALEEALAAEPPDGHGLTWLPFIAGERSPGWTPHARATISGLTLDTPAIGILRAALEAVAYRFALIDHLLQAAMPGERAIVASGNGLLRNPTWMQIVADVLGRPVLASTEPEASLKGAAVMALTRLGVPGPDGKPATIASLAAPALTGARRFAPDPANEPIYRAARERQRELYEKVMPGG